MINKDYINELEGNVAIAEPPYLAPPKKSSINQDFVESLLAGEHKEVQENKSKLPPMADPDKPMDFFADPVPPTGIPDIVDPQGLTGDIRQPAREDPLRALKQTKGLARGAENVIGTVGSMAQWAAERATIGNILTKHQDLPYGSGVVAEYLVRKFGPEKPVEFYEKRMAEHADKGKKWADFWEEQAQKGWEAPDPEVTQAKWRDMPITKGVATISEAAPNYLAAIASSVLTKSPQTGLLFISGLSGAGAYRRQREAGAGVAKADAIATMTGAWEYVTELVPFKELFKPSKSIFNKMLKLGTMEAAQEFVQGIGENFLEYFGYTAKDLESVPAAVKEGLQHTMDGWVENVVAGAGLGIMGGGIVPKRGLRTPPGRADIAKEQEIVQPAAEKRTQAIDYVKSELSQEQYADLDEKARIEIGQRMLAEQGVEVEAEELAEAPPTVPIAEPETPAEPITTPEAKITPDKAKPMTVYRAGDLEPKVSTPPDLKGLYFADTKDLAEAYTTKEGGPEVEKETRKYVIELKNPATREIENQVAQELGVPSGVPEEFGAGVGYGLPQYDSDTAIMVQEELKRRGYDGVIRENGEIIAFDKSAVAQPPAKAKGEKEWLQQWEKSILEEVKQEGTYDKTGGIARTYYVPPGIKEKLKTLGKTPQEYAKDYVQEHKTEILEGYKKDLERKARRKAPITPAKAEPTKVEKKGVYTSTPTEWHGETDLYDWGKKGLRSRGNQKIGNRKTFIWQSEFEEVPVRLNQMKKILDAIRSRTDEIFKVHTRKSDDYYLAPPQVVKEVKSELGEDAFKQKPKPERTPLQKINDTINSARRKDLTNTEIGAIIEGYAKTLGLTEKELSANQKRYIEALNNDPEAQTIRQSFREGVEEAVQPTEEEVEERLGIQEQGLTEEIGGFLDGIVEKTRPTDLIGRPILEGGAAGKQTEFLAKEKYRLPEPDIEGQMKLKTEQVKPKGKVKATPTKRIVSQNAYDAAKKRLTDQSTLRMGVDPQGMADIITIGAYHFENGIRKFAAWSKKMVEDMGDWVKPHLEEVWPLVQSMATGEAQTKETVSETPPDVQKILKRAKNLAPLTVTKETKDAENLMDGYFAERDEKQKEADIDAANYQKRIRGALGDKKRGGWKMRHKRADSAMQVYIDLKSNPDQIKYLDKLSKLQKTIVDMAQDLPAELKTIADAIIKQNKELGLDALDVGVITNVLDNYTMRLWESEKHRTWLGRKFGTKTARAKHRTLEGILHGWSLGKELKIQGATNAQQVMRKQISDTIVDRQLLKMGKTWGLISDQKLEEWVQVEHPNFTDWKWRGAVEIDEKAQPKKGDKVRPTDRGNIGTIVAVHDNGTADVHFVNRAKGTQATKTFNMDELKGKVVRPYGRNFFVTDDGNLMERVPMYAEPELGKHLNNVLGTSALYKLPGIRWATEWNARLKRWILFTSFFHHQAYIRSYTLGGKTGFKDISVKQAYKAGRTAIENFTPDLRRGVRNGLTIGKIQDYDEAALKGKHTIFGRILRKAKAVDVTVKQLEKLRDWNENFLFGKLGPFLKVQAYLLEYKSSVAKHKKQLENGNMTLDDIAKIAANLVNDDFGGLHLERKGRNPTLQHLFRLLALAPDWTESNVASAVKAFKAGEEGRVYRAFWARIAMKGVAALVLWNYLMALFDDDDEEAKGVNARFIRNYKQAWEDGQMRWMDVNITPIYKALGGKADKRKYFSLLGHFKDPIKFVARETIKEGKLKGVPDVPKSLIKSAKYKGSVLTRIIADGITGTDWAGREFTTLSELIGTDDKGEYVTTRKGAYKKGEPKGGKLKGELTKWSMGGVKTLGLEQIPSFLIHETQSNMPIQVQNSIKYLVGQMDGFDAALKSAGVYISSTYSPYDKLKNLSRKELLNQKTANTYQKTQYPKSKGIIKGRPHKGKEQLVAEINKLLNKKAE